ncbi:hypothetical protein V8C42DRAFT_314167 [Trichoderma barbatum]
MMTNQNSNVEMQVLVLGLPRTATTSIAAALQSDILAIKPVLHASDTAANQHRCRLILEALRLLGDAKSFTRHAKLHQVVDGYAACTESLNALADDLMDMYPNAKLILNVRPPSDSGGPAALDWARSCKETVGFFGSHYALAVCWPLPHHRFWWRRYRLQTDVWRHKGLLSGKTSKCTAFKGCEWMTPEFYNRYLEWVQGEARERGRDVLVWHPGMGWKPLCELLGREIPPEDTPIPVLNDSTASKLGQRGYIRRGLCRYATFFMLLVAYRWLH